MDRATADSRAMRFTRTLALCGVAAPLWFVATVAFASSQYIGYSQMAQATSELGGVDARHPAIKNVNFFVLGLLIIAFAAGLRRGVADRRRSLSGPLLIGMFGLSSGIGNALLRCDTGCNFETLPGTLHNLTGLTGFIAAIVGIFLTTRRFSADRHWRPLRRFSPAAGVCVLQGALSRGS